MTLSKLASIQVCKFSFSLVCDKDDLLGKMDCKDRIFVRYLESQLEFHPREQIACNYLSHPAGHEMIKSI